MSILNLSMASLYGIRCELHWTTLSCDARYLEDAAFSISISSSVFIFLWLFSRCIMDIVSSIISISSPSSRTCSENLDLSSAYLKSCNFFYVLVCFCSLIFFLSWNMYIYCSYTTRSSFSL